MSRTALLGLAHGFWILVRGDTSGGVREFTVEAFKFSGGRPNQSSPLEFGTDYLLVFLTVIFKKDF
jgi:hypothetical protein